MLVWTSHPRRPALVELAQVFQTDGLVNDKLHLKRQKMDKPEWDIYCEALLSVYLIRRQFATIKHQSGHYWGRVCVDQRTCYFTPIPFDQGLNLIWRYLLYTPYLLRDSHPVSGVRVSTIQLGLHPAPHSHGVGVLFLQSFSRPLVSHYSLAGAVDYQQQRHNDIIIIIVI